MGKTSAEALVQLRTDHQAAGVLGASGTLAARSTTPRATKCFTLLALDTTTLSTQKAACQPPCKIINRVHDAPSKCAVLSCSLQDLPRKVGDRRACMKHPAERDDRMGMPGEQELPDIY